MNATKGFILCIALAGLVGCNESHRSASITAPPPLQTLDSFVLVDSFGVDSEVSSHTPLEIDPYYYDGVFEIYWGVERGSQYDFYLSVGPTANINDSLTVYSESCGPGQYCGFTGGAICQYSADFTLGCADQPAVDIYDIFVEVPQAMYLFAEACDRDGCSFRRLPVTMF
ncbi:hypothetical protein KO507_11950 [Gilvimarinus agarilyticus]|uniref:hypothetical protein n=1 Tax=unclassified Gilvimarinus TaxID=2642066 RepID=UPI001C092EE9|nr:MULTISPECIES: hypothetical protein [unclassified Gilvimarinus]MBU2886477.1 hypothetical protein [Gilvimarinus agarilyticus]MDO6571156.1 hypothetical protein [Gilvimarinus sp. 2_MG-2023]MDO6748543.1 hypothetical protein [Gilvimarinus sp. 1_MG-2023]